MYWTMHSSMVSPPTRTLREKTMPASEITATSQVPLMAAAAGLPYPALLAELVRSAS